jgi:hypothetical protein
VNGLAALALLAFGLGGLGGLAKLSEKVRNRRAHDSLDWALRWMENSDED